MSKFQIGDEVTLSRDSEYFGCDFGIQLNDNIGVISLIEDCDCGIQVSWGEYENGYNECDLVLVRSANGKEPCTAVVIDEVQTKEAEVVGGVAAQTSQWTDKHYDFNYTLTQTDIERGSIKLDPYFVYGQWHLHEVDKYGVLMHQIKTLSRFGRKNDIMREIDALIGQATRLKQLVENEKPVENKNE